MAMDGDNSTLALKANPTGQGLLLVSLALLAFGAVMVYSASIRLTPPAGWLERVEVRHLIYAVLAGLLLTVLWRFDYRRLAGGGLFPWPAAALLGFSVLLGLLVLAPRIGLNVPGVVRINGARRWMQFHLGGFLLSFQPSEMIKLSLLIFLASWLGRMSPQQAKRFRRTFLPAVGLIAVCVGVVIIEDFGTAAIIGLSATAVLMLARVRWYYLLVLLPLAAVGFYVFVIRVPARMDRIQAFIDPNNPKAYHVHQALIAVGSGGLWGKGLGNGTQKLGFVPEDNTDFIFSVICEELGFAGAVLVLGLFGILLYLSWRATRSSREGVGRLLAGGLGLLITMQALAHIAVNVGSAPPKGISLPLVSAGGTALVFVAIAISLIVSVTAHSPPVKDDR